MDAKILGGMQMQKKDPTTYTGLILGTIVILISLIWGQNDIGKTLRLFYDIPSIFIVIFGSLSAIIVSFQWETIKSIPSILKNAFVTRKESKVEILTIFVVLSKKARKEGLLALEDEVDKIDNKYMKSGLHMIIDGFEQDKVDHIFELEMDELEKRHKKCIQVFKMWANLAPSFGMLGTFIGLILMMANLQDMSKFASGFATVLVTSFYGAILSNLVFAPLANKLDIKNQEEINIMDMVLEGLDSICSGANPRVMEENLKAFLSDKEKLEYELSSSLKAQQEEVVKDAA